jgi:hypothetical protein
MKHYETLGYRTIRASGSHGEWDVVCYRSWVKPNFIQCKVVDSEAAAKRLIAKFENAPERYFHQTLRVKVKGTKTPMEVTI